MAARHRKKSADPRQQPLWDANAPILPLRAKDITGLRSGHLTALRYVGRSGSALMWECRCDCGEVITVPSTKISSDRLKSCGCRTIAMRQDAHANARLQFPRHFSEFDIQATLKFHFLGLGYDARGEVTVGRMRLDLVVFDAKTLAPVRIIETKNHAIDAVSQESLAKYRTLGVPVDVIRGMPHAIAYIMHIAEHGFPVIPIFPPRYTPPNPIDRAGRVNMLTVLYRLDRKGKGHKGWYWRCRCDCGKELDVVADRLRGKRTLKSCGCDRSAVIQLNKLGRKKGHRRVRVALATQHEPLTVQEIAKATRLTNQDVRGVINGQFKHQFTESQKNGKNAYQYTGDYLTPEVISFAQSHPYTLTQSIKAATAKS